MHPEWYYRKYNHIFGRGISRYVMEISRVESMVDLSDADIQEIGAGTGNHAAAILKYPVRSITLTDCDQKATAVLAKRFAGDTRVIIEFADGFIPISGVHYDLIYSMYSVAIQGLETALGFEHRLAILRDRLRPGGAFVYEAIDGDVSERIYPSGEESVIFHDKLTGERVFISSTYNKNSITIRYSGSLNQEPIIYSVSLLRLNYEALVNITGEVFGSTPHVVWLDESGRRLLIKGQRT